MLKFRHFRHTRGFGVHSPFGFELVGRVIRPGRLYSFYGYDALKRHARICGATPGELREAKFLLRLCSMMNPESCCCKTNLNFAPMACQQARSDIKFFAANAYNNADLLITDEGCITTNELTQYISKPGRILYLRYANKESANILFENLSEGIMFEGRHQILVITRSEMQKLRYKMKI